MEQAAGECINSPSGRSNLATRMGHAPTRVSGQWPGRHPRMRGGVRVGRFGLTYTADLVTNRPLGCLFEVVETLVLTLIIFLVIQTFVAQPYRVEQQSMEHTLEPDQYVLVDKLSPRWDDYSRGDIVVFDPPPGWVLDSPPTPFIKRVIGLPGDVVEVKDGGVYVNGTRLDEPYVYDGQPTVASDETARWVVPAGELFVMGDHRAASEDSRVFGPISRDRVIGRAWLRYWPIDTLGVLSTPTYPAPVGSGDARPSTAVP